MNRSQRQFELGVRGVVFSVHGPGRFGEYRVEAVHDVVGRVGRQVLLGSQDELLEQLAAA